MVENFKPFSLEKMYNVITIKQKCKYILNALYMCQNLVKNDTLVYLENTKNVYLFYEIINFKTSKMQDNKWLHVF